MSRKHESESPNDAARLAPLPLDGEPGGDFDTVGERRQRLGLPRPAHGSESWRIGPDIDPIVLERERARLVAPELSVEPGKVTAMGYRLADLAPLIPYVASSKLAAAELQAAIDRTRAMFEHSRAELLIARAVEVSTGSSMSLADAIHQEADREARRDHERAIESKRTPLGLDAAGEAYKRERDELAARLRDRLGHVYAPCTLEPILEAPAWDPTALVEWDDDYRDRHDEPDDDAYWPTNGKV